MLCDDDEGVLEQLRAGLQARYGEAGARIAAFTAPQDALAEVQKNPDWETAILDILMPGMDGTRLAAAMRKAGFAGEFIFFTSSRDYAPESYEVRALDYLLKPLDTARLEATLDRLDEVLLKRDNAFIVLTAGRTGRRVPLREILCAESGDHAVHFCLAGGVHLSVRGNLSDHSPALLADPRFAACHGSFVVNMDEIYALDDSDVILTDGRRVPIAKRYTGFRRQYMKWLTGGGKEG